MDSERVVIHTAGTELSAELAGPATARGVVLFAHGTGGSRHSPRNRAAAATLRRHGFATVLADLLTRQEERADRPRFDIGLLAERLVGIVDRLGAHPATTGLPIGLDGAGTGAAAALVAAAARPLLVRAVVSRGGRPDLAGDAVAEVSAPTLLIVGGADRPVLALNRNAARRMIAPHRLHVVPGATHLLEEPGALEEVAEQAAGWFGDHLGSPHTPATAFHDRAEAGHALAGSVAERLPRTDGRCSPLVLALPRGGVPVAAEVARAVGGELDVIVARKIGVPWRPESGIGAVTSSGPPVFDHASLRGVDLNADDLRAEVDRERAEALRRYRGDRPEPQVTGRTVVVVDDGLTAGVTARAALLAVREEHPESLLFAAPVCAPEAVEALGDEADGVVCVRRPDGVPAVNLWYRDFAQIGDAEVERILERAALARG